ncbi:MAG: bacteriohemerythrin [Treponema sp.]|jgi:methyl-accepting chemotaxis protein|nr:bacteriohemerythrin [Treponema sp.]
MKKTIRLQTRILFFFTVIILVLSATTTILSVRKSIDVASAIFAREGIKYARNAVSIIDGDKFEALSISLNELDPFYESTRMELLKIRNEANLEYLYTIAPSVGVGYRYIIDGSGEIASDTFSHLGDSINIDDYGDTFFKTWETKKGRSSTLEKGDWGFLVSVYEPIFNSRGDMVGILGCDFDAQFLYDSLKAQVIEQIVLGVIFAIAGVGIMFSMMRMIFIRLGRISEILGILAKGEGNLSARITIRRNDEIGIMAGLFNKTLDKICELILLIKNQTVNLSNVGNELSENMNQTAASVTEITSHLQHIKSQVLNQSASVTETNATMEQVLNNIDNLSAQVEVQTENVTQSSSAIEEMIANIQSVTNTLVKNAENVNDLIAVSNVGRTSLEEVSQDIQGIARESEGILEINAVMQNIASQTNLLSMNAAIEAAHAGEAGKGFAVVADEIRKLAESSSKQSKTISTVLKKIKESIDKITKSTGVVLEKFKDIDAEVRTVAQQESNIRNAMEEQSVGSKQILEAIGKLQETTKKVKDSSVEMLEGSRQVIKEGKTLASATSEISDGVNEITSEAEDINSTVKRVLDAADNNKKHISVLSTEVERFKVTSSTEYVWDKSFSLGYHKIDEQHRQLFNALNNLVKACNLDIREDFDKYIAFLGNYTEKHFADEEEIQKSCGYPDFENHKKIHDDFKLAVGNFSSQWLALGPTETVLSEIHTHVGGWLINHIKAQDVKIGTFIRNKTKKVKS